jgi:SAM-dependent methyltransferase
MKTLVTSLNELRRHLVLKLTGRPGVSFVGKGAASRNHLKRQTPSDRFEEIYAQGVWQKGDQEIPKSGPGSSLQATDSLRRHLSNILDEIAAKTLLDVGCGDFTWMNQIELRQNYVGVDIVPSVIADNARYAGPKRQFLCIDAVSGDLPEADIILCRETLFHLSFADGRRLLRNAFSRPRSWFLCTTESDTWFNADIHTGDYRPLNLRRPPFGFPPPYRIIEDAAVRRGRAIGVWPVQSLPRFD